MRRSRKLIGDEEGSELVDFALAAGTFFMLAFGVIDFCMLIYAGSFVAFATQQGTRYAMVRGSDWTSSCATTTSYGCKVTSPTDVQNYVLSLPHPGVNLVASNISVTWAGTTAAGSSTACAANPYGQGCQVKVGISYTFNLNIPFFAASIPLSASSIETIQN